MREGRPGRWELRVYVGTDPQTRRRLYRTHTVRGTRTEAEREPASFVAAVSDRSVTGATTTVGELLERWFELTAPSWSPATVRQTRSVLRCQLLPALGAVRLGDLSAERIDRLYADLRTNGGQRGQPLAAGTIKRVHVVVHSALAQGMRWGWIWDNPADRAHRIVAVAREPQPPSVEELGVLLDHVRALDPAFHVLLVLAATTGARRASCSGCDGATSTSTTPRSPSVAAGSKARPGVDCHEQQATPRRRHRRHRRGPPRRASGPMLRRRRRGS
jgi:hypothetical protein